MSDLDDKLNNISIWIEANRDVSPGRWEDDVWPEIKSRLKQAFLDEGYRPYSTYTRITSQDGETTVESGIPVLTGQEWYERFKGEYHKIPKYEPEDYPEAYEIAAKKAAGLNE